MLGMGLSLPLHLRQPVAGSIFAIYSPDCFLLRKVMDTLTQTERSRRMGLVRSADTKPEIFVRRMLSRLGFRYRLHARNLPGCPDIVFRGRKKIIFIQGCFWHRHSSTTCNLARMPKSRKAFWSAKLEANRQRDQVNQRKLRRSGWHVLQVWECELKNIDKLERRIVRFLQ